MGGSFLDSSIPPESVESKFSYAKIFLLRRSLDKVDRMVYT